MQVYVLRLDLFRRDWYSKSDIVEPIKIMYSEVDQDPIVEAIN